VQSVQRFDPSREEIERASAKASAAARMSAAQAEPIDLPPVRAADLSPRVIESLKQLCEDFRGSAEVRLVVEMGGGLRRRLRLGEEYRVANTPSLRAELASILPSPPAAAQALEQSAAAG
jgi:hypothetical protein